MTAAAETTLPADHPDRLRLAAEVHARPSAELTTPERATYVAVLIAGDARQRELQHLAALCELHHVAPPEEGATHCSFTLGALRVKWERHSEFSGYAFFVPGSSSPPFAEPATALLPAGWLAGIPGQTIVAVHAELQVADSLLPTSAALTRQFDGNMVIGAEVGDGAGAVFTDFRVHDDGCAHFLVLDRSFSARQAGRTLQRLFEIEAYRMVAMLALPIARTLAPRILAIEQALGSLTAQIAKGAGGDEALLQELTHLAAEIESALAASQFRFGASRAYYELVLARITELRERRIAGIPTIAEFMTRRLAPAMATCSTVSQRLRDLSERIAQASGLLSTRVEIAREQQNQQLLASMDRRARLQLRLQQAVEGLSIAAVTYYGVGLVGYAAKALKAGGVQVDAELVTGAAIPVVALLVALAVRRVRRRLTGGESEPRS